MVILILKTLLAVLWKFGIFIKKHPFIIILQAILIPLGVMYVPSFLLEFILKGEFNMKKHNEQTVHDIITSDFDQMCFSVMSAEPYTIAYAPKTEFTTKIINKVKENIWTGNKLRSLVALNTEAEISESLKAIPGADDALNYGILFETVKEAEKEFKYKIIGFLQLDTNIKFPEHELPGPMYAGSDYLTKCYLALQKALDVAFIELVSKQDPLNYEINLQAFPYPEYINDELIDFMVTAISFSLMVSFILPIAFIIKAILEEKRSGIRELMKLSGLKGVYIWSGWVLHANLICLLIYLIAYLLYNFTVQYSNKLVILLMLCLWFNSVLVYLFLFCSIFNSVPVCICVSSILYFLGYFGTQKSVNLLTSKLNIDEAKYIACFSPPHVLHQIIYIIWDYEDRGLGVNWINLNTILKKDEITLGTLLMSTILSIVTISLLTWYVDTINPGPYGMPGRWCFLCKTDSGKENLEFSSPVLKNYETPPNLPIGISIQNLRKVFSPGVVAVERIDINFYRGEITVLLGHNGAGKTTTMFMITGMSKPTTGAIYKTDRETNMVYDAVKNMSKFRRSLGLCPQYNMLFPNLTCNEHLILFGLIKHMPWRQCREQRKYLFDILDLSSKKNVLACKLSGGMKRKLCLAIALIGDPEVLILDEPTSGMDTESRRHVWDILLRIRHNRTTIISTHEMEEADVLGNRIAIMSHGEVQCYGTPMYLKRIYGTGYSLKVLLGQNSSLESLKTLVKSHVPDSTFTLQKEGEIVFLLPSHQTHLFGKLFEALESRNSNNRSGFTVSHTTMEEVFLKVGTSVMTRDNGIDNPVPHQVTRSEGIGRARNSGCVLCMQRFYILVLKKFKCEARKLLTTISFIVFVFLMGLVSGLVAISFTRAGSATKPALKFPNDYYKGSKLLVTYDNAGDGFSEYTELATGRYKLQTFEYGNIVEELLKVAKEDLKGYRFSHVIGADWKAKSVTALFSTIAVHSAPESLRIVTNSILKSFKKDFSIVSYNVPLTIMSPESCLYLGSMIGTVWVFTVNIALVCLIVNMIAFPLNERISSAKHIQLMTGTSPITYWLSIYVIDLMIYSIAVASLVFAFFIVEYILYHEAVYVTLKDLSMLLLIEFMFGMSCILFGYVLSLFGRSFGTAVAVFVTVNLILGCIAVAFKFSLTIKAFLPEFYLKFLHWMYFLLLAFPSSCLTMLSIAYNEILFANGKCSFCMAADLNKCSDFKPLPYLKSVDFGTTDLEEIKISNLLIALAVDTLVYFAILLLNEYMLFQKMFGVLQRLSSSKSQRTLLNEEVSKEQSVIDSVLLDQAVRNEYALIVDKLVKTYGLFFVAVKGISFTVKHGECFGLLGTNGAGKTTAFKMLTGEIHPTFGNAYILDYTLTKKRYSYLKQIGYCPQFDAINTQLTGREMVEVYAHLRGIKLGNIKSETEHWLAMLGLTNYSNRRCGTYSGGNKRKLNVAMAMIGNPVIIFLDEPTSGVDPESRRKMWTVIQNAQTKRNQSFVLTSHSMDECETLCDKLTIMVKGEMMCHGTTDYLKNRYSQGFTIMIKLKPQEGLQVGRLKSAMNTAFINACVLKDENTGLLQYNVDASLKRSVLFHKMETLKRESEIVDSYSISETSLYEVFMSFTRDN